MAGEVKLRSYRRRNSGDFASDFASTYSIGRQIGEDFRNADTRSQIEQVDQDYTPTETEVASGEEQVTAAQNAKAQALSNATTDEQRAQVEKDYAPTLAALESKRLTPASIVYSTGVGNAFRQQDQPFSSNDVAAAKAQARADIYARAGKNDEATKTLQNEARRRELADQTELRAAMSRKPNLAAGVTDMADVMGDAPPTSAGNHGTLSISGEAGPSPMARNAGTPAAAVAETGLRSARDPMDFFYKEQVPKAIQTLVKQGRIEDAKRYSDFLESQEGQEYAKAYMAGVRRWAVGDHDGALGHFADLYNRDLFPDGRKVKMTRLDDGQLKIDQVDKDGNVVGSKTGKISDLTEQAALMLNPMQAVRFLTEQTAKRRGEQASLDKAIELELLRQERSDRAEDRRDERLQMRLDAQARRNADGGKLTEAQLRTNAEIDAARKEMAGMSPDEVKKRISSFTATGRENPDYDPQVAQAFKLSIKRKYGPDDEHDQLVASLGERNGRAPASSPAPAAEAGSGNPKGPTPIEAARKAFDADESMRGYSLGKQTVRGFEVLDKNGKLVGHYGRQ
jgi:hypothetical protein